MRTLITHPGLQYSHQLAVAMERRGHLAAFWSGVPVVDSVPTDQREIWARFGVQVRRVPIPAAKRRHFAMFPLLRRAVNTATSGRTALLLSHLFEHLFDVWVSRQIGTVAPDVVVCYENAAYRSFLAAKSIGALCVLDAASIHHEAAKRLGGDAMPRSAGWIDRQKDAEVLLADLILTCSDFARQSYINAGVPSEKIFVANLGTILPCVPKPVARQQHTCSFVFCGSATRRKGFDLLLDVFAEFLTAQVPARLVVIGGGGDQDLDARARKLSNVSMLPFMHHDRLFIEVSKHDCLVLPSRFDSFGMVVPEAMALGVPVVVSDRVGARSIIEANPSCGWIVEFDKASLRHRLLWIVENVSARECAALAAPAAAHGFTWEQYGERVISIVEAAYASAGKRAWQTAPRA